MPKSAELENLRQRSIAKPNTDPSKGRFEGCGNAAFREAHRRLWAVHAPALVGTALM